MERMYSRQQPDVLLHTIIRAHDFDRKRQDASPPDESLQVAFFDMANLQTFRPHMHIPHERAVPQTQESWVIVRGAVLATYYDLDGTVHSQQALLPGDCTITFRGGHNYAAMEDGTRVYEFKSGRFEGVECDKQFI